MASGHASRHGQRPWPVAMTSGHGQWPWPVASGQWPWPWRWPWPLAMAMASGQWPWPLAMGIRAILAIRASGQSNSAIRAILAIRAIQASGHPGIRKPPGAPMGHRGPDTIDRPASLRGSELDVFIFGPISFIQWRNEFWAIDSIRAFIRELVSGHPGTGFLSGNSRICMYPGIRA